MKAKSLEEAVERCRRDPRLRERLVAEYRLISGEPNPVPSPMPEEWWVDVAMLLRAMGLMGWAPPPTGGPAGLTRLGALAAHELNRERTRQRQVNDVIMQLNAAELAERKAWEEAEFVEREAYKDLTAGEIAGSMIELKASMEGLKAKAITATEAQEKFYAGLDLGWLRPTFTAGRRTAAGKITAVDLT